MLYIDTVVWEAENDTEMQKELEKWGYSKSMKLIGDWLGTSGCGYVLIQDVENIEVHTNNTIHWRPVWVFDSLYPAEAS